MVLYAMRQQTLERVEVVATSFASARLRAVALERHLPAAYGGRG
jgi:hypothetical protein